MNRENGRDRGGSAKAYGADLTKAAEVQEMIDQIIKEWGCLDILVNNAGDVRDALLTVNDGRSLDLWWT